MNARMTLTTHREPSTGCFLYDTAAPESAWSMSAVTDFSNPAREETRRRSLLNRNERFRRDRFIAMISS